ncbi:hypothetical protein [Cereibacter azotoformans]|uniref:Uncharacterized protein n=1 Tax=Cereibacter azotoformans TaxID=43057 RepID=A0A2T5JMD4_9RHOB|nr:hypothetical protein [Cereibacter azotoformans]MBO4168852.1 hypothetical protein [Cereibacter azotoformans]PTR08163.1 hypothetical protein C8J28_1379 [Cereibacter azotoformans]
MPRYVDEEVGKIVRRRTVKTFGDKVKEFVQQLIGGVVVIFIISVAIKILS